MMTPIEITMIVLIPLLLIAGFWPWDDHGAVLRRELRRLDGQGIPRPEGGWPSLSAETEEIIEGEIVE